MSQKKFVTFALTHAGKLVQICGIDVSPGEQDAKVKSIKRDAKDGAHHEYSVVFDPIKLSGGHQFLSPADAKKSQDAIAKQQKEYEKLQAEEKEKAETERLAKLTPAEREAEAKAKADKAKQEAAAAEAERARAKAATTHAHEPAHSHGHAPHTHKK